ncbi:NAD(P)/FAD-dependent oxidoreductase [Niabella insulamsoli]|uniref:NAD(P)/FAD-dependent oxidoreductase n=1 Tax=Niabella insulamsoli TaxID=3144874 RepID=UPI0031FC6F95
MQKEFEVIIIGGSYAGLSAALSLGRSLRQVLVLDHGEPCNRQTPHSHNFLTQDGVAPAAIAAIAKEQLERYSTVQLVNSMAVSGQKVRGHFEITTADGHAFTAKKLIFASGLKDQLPTIDGLRECWGISAIHCPYCHGYEFKKEKTAIMAQGERALHLAALVSNLTDQLTILTNGAADFSEEQYDRLRRHRISVVENKITKLEHQNGHLKKIHFEDNQPLELDAVYTAFIFVQSSAIPESLGCALSESGYLVVDPFQKTNIDQVYACGDCCAPMRSVASAVMTGNMAGAMVNKELCDAAFT